MKNISNHIEGMLGMVASFPWGYDFFYLPFTGMDCEKIPGGFPDFVPILPNPSRYFLLSAVLTVNGKLSALCKIVKVVICLTKANRLLLIYDVNLLGR